MKTLASFTAALALVLNVQSEIITLSAYAPPQGEDPAKRYTQSVEIGADQTIELLSTSRRDGNAIISIEREGHELIWQRTLAPLTLQPTDTLLLRGPAKLTLKGADGGAYILATFRITPERVDPTKTVIVYPGTNNAAQVTLLCSTNLTDWFPATNGVYSGPVAKFFRIGLEKVE